MTTEYRDENGNLLRTDTGTKPRPAPSLKPIKATPAPVTPTDAIAPAKKEK